MAGVFLFCFQAQKEEQKAAGQGCPDQGTTEGTLGLWVQLGSHTLIREMYMEHTLVTV